jgi:hypothetical protein
LREFDGFVGIQESRYHLDANFTATMRRVGSGLIRIDFLQVYVAGELEKVKDRTLKFEGCGTQGGI